MADNTVSTNPVMMTDKLAYDTYYETGETQL